jgi:hypothetical protein
MSQPFKVLRGSRKPIPLARQWAFLTRFCNIKQEHQYYVFKVYERDALNITTYAVLKIDGWTLYSLAKTKGTIPCGRAACHMQISYINIYRI